MTPEERIKAAAKALMNDAGGWWTDADASRPEVEKAKEQWRRRALLALAAAYPEDFPPKPKWPTDESVIRFKGAYHSSTNSDIPMSDEWVRDCLREAFLADPVHKAAVDCVAPGQQPKLAALKRAIDEAWL